MHPVIFLGAGASASDGAPLQNTIFRDYFTEIVAKRQGFDTIDSELRTFFDELFFIDVDDARMAVERWPTFEEVFALVDLALSRSESFPEFDSGSMADNSGRLRFVSQNLVFLIARILDLRLKGQAKNHIKLIENLERGGILPATSFISTNYDILIDNALIRANSQQGIDYGFDLVGNRSRLGGVNLFKIHGSLNWLHCPQCNTIKLTAGEKGVVTQLSDGWGNGSSCDECESVYVPILVPPTYFKNMNKSCLVETWNRAEQELRKSTHLVFCGYSFPDADAHIKYLVKRGQLNRNRGSLPPKIFVVNNHEGKSDSQRSEERNKFRRFLGDGVNYTSMSFDQFADDPMSIIR